MAKFRRDWKVRTEECPTFHIVSLQDFEGQVKQEKKRDTEEGAQPSITTLSLSLYSMEENQWRDRRQMEKRMW
ncbi:hypothetical protein DAMNIGENAA_27980 [Desulforhabdus amnigena]|uniref:Uncharacterized protein n=1 Tax=Desulforhabdus amnigena TaxID=40218 RepID=A0A9W6FUX2_9BACT|nr:hypothetical protein DAMNIGENAA_27980 [Desulforhabdus amnigena]